MSAGWITKLNESNSKLHKEDVIKQAYEMALLGDRNSQRFLVLVNMCYNPMITFGVKQVEDTVGYSEQENPWDDFIALLNQLKDRMLTGHAARDAIIAMSERFDSIEWNLLCAPVLRRDLRCGISDKTFNKVCRGTDYQIPVFSCQLATSCEDRPEMQGEMRIEPKLDGVRVLMYCAVGDQGYSYVISYSRNGKVFDNFTHIEHQLQEQMTELARRSGHKEFFLDGEVVGKSFNELMRVARKKKDAKADDSVFHVFDFIPASDFVRGHWNAQLSKRLTILDKIKPVIKKMPNVEYPDHLIVNLDVNEGRDQLWRYAQDCVKAGYEGVMIKAMEAPYECRRSTSWMKWKPTITVDLQITAIEEGTGKNQGRLGAFVCSGVDSGKTITVNVGSGITDEERDEYWHEKDALIGQTVEILCDSISQNQDGTYSLRFPRFLRFRDDK